ncbi:hypothetical protein UFOVP410_151 [uncultured Caudovirales phage]|uniref:Uncharacterized protein n=1 Tax=uncultured Caudovirales phage TaxID=2100421 RepID=A0A6J5M572_9CAUD|nr:hypothetical protein UFOVP410_151 [uncultured Caudovirales phage]
MRLDMKTLHAKVAIAHNSIVVGKTYFLSNFYDKEGATVRVISKSSKRKNRAGFYSIVNAEILESDYHYYKVGEIHTVNATNLYDKRSDASASNRWNQPIGL